MSAIIRPAAEARALAALKLETFRESFVDGGFAIPYPPEDVGVFQAKHYSVDKIAAELADPARMNWVAEADGRMLGYAQVGPAKLPHPEVRPEHGELYQLYVRNEAQGMKLGGRLLAQALAVWSRHLMVHYPQVSGRMRYGPDFTRERPNDRGSPSSDTT